MRSTSAEVSTATVLPMRPTRTRSLQLTVVSMLIASAMAMSWFGAPPVPALVGALGSGGVLLWRLRRG
jgi:hypothetical protein